MKTDRIHPRLTDARDPVVTYSRVPSRTRSRSSALSSVERLEPRVDAVEIPPVDPHDDVDPAFVAPRPEMRAGALDVALAERSGGTGPMRVIVFGAALAVLAGAGVLAASIGVATIIPGGSPAGSAPVGETALGSTRADPLPEAAAASVAVREIPLAVGEEAPAAEAVATIAPPLPRPRPEVKAASLEPGPLERQVLRPEPEVAATPPVLAPPTEVVAEPKPAGNTGAEVVPPATATSEPNPRPQGTDALITSIEATLEKIDKAPAGAASATVAAAPPAILPPPPPEQSASMLPPPYPPADEGCPPSDTGFGPCYDVMPPEPLTNGYYAPGPVPPEPVPYPYPPAGSDDRSWSNGGTGPGDGTASAGESDEPSARGPGVVRRAITRTADAVGRVLGRDR